MASLIEQFIVASFFNKRTLNMAFLFATIGVIAYRFLGFNIVDLLVLAYLALAILLAWDWRTVVGGGIFVMIVTVLTQGNYPEEDAHRLAIYQWGLISGGLILALRAHLNEIAQRVVYWSTATKRLPTPGPLFWKKAIHRAQEELIQRYRRGSDQWLLVAKVKLVALAAMALVLIFLIEWEGARIFFVLFFLYGLLFQLDSRVAIGGALACLVLIPLVMLLEGNLVAEMVAVYGYYFLVIGVVERIIESCRGQKIVAQNIHRV